MTLHEKTLKSIQDFPSERLEKGNEVLESKQGVFCENGSRRSAGEDAERDQAVMGSVGISLRAKGFLPILIACFLAWPSSAQTELNPPEFSVTGTIRSEPFTLTFRHDQLSAPPPNFYLLHA